MKPSYNMRVMQIYQEFAMGISDRETSMTKFEDLLHEYGLLPVEEQLDRTITNENFVSLLRMASEQANIDAANESSSTAPIHRDARSNREPEVNSLVNYNEQALTHPNYRIADSIMQSCPVCKTKVSGLYNRMQGLDNQIIPVDPPRCKTCMTKWVEEHLGAGIGSSLATPYPIVTVDNTEATPLDQAEIDFFSLYEDQMRDFKP